MAFPLLADVAASIAELQRDPIRVIREGDGKTVLIIHRNKPAFYAVPPELYDAMLDMIGDAECLERSNGRPSKKLNNKTQYNHYRDSNETNQPIAARVR